MSAYMVDREHINYLVSTACKYSYSKRNQGGFSWFHDGEWSKLEAPNRDHASAIGQVLWNANLRSINARYPDTVTDPSRMPGRIDETYIYAHSKDYPFDMIESVQVLQSIACLEYQSCEFDGWGKSEAHAILEALKSAAIHALPGYDKTVWGAPALPVKGGK